VPYLFGAHGDGAVVRARARWWLEVRRQVKEIKGTMAREADTAFAVDLLTRAAIKE